MKKMFICFLLFLFVIGIKVSASSLSASIYGYAFSNEFEYYGDYDLDELRAQENNGYYYGSVWTWMGAYTYYDQVNNELFVLLMCTGQMQPNQNSYWDQFRWNNQSMEIVFYSSSADVSIVNYSPETTSGEISISNSVSVGGDSNSEGTNSLNFSVSSSSSYTVSEAPVSVLRDGSNKLTIKHSLLNYSTNKALGNLCTSLFKRNNMVVYKIENYNSDNHYVFNIYNTVEFYRYGLFNCKTMEVIHQQYFIL